MLLKFCAVVFEGYGVSDLADAVVVGAFLGGGRDAVEVAEIGGGGPALQCFMQQPFYLVVVDSLLLVKFRCDLRTVAVGRETQSYDDSACCGLYVFGKIPEGEIFKVDEFRMEVMPSC